MRPVNNKIEQGMIEVIKKSGKYGSFGIKILS
jgi:hypothetical protein